MDQMLCDKPNVSPTSLYQFSTSWTLFHIIGDVARLYSQDTHKILFWK